MFLEETKKLIAMHGAPVTYTAVTEGAYNVETGTVTNSETSISITAYPKRIRATQFNYPNLIGRTVFELLVAGDALVALPKQQDKIVLQTETYTVEASTAIYAEGIIVLLKILVSKS